MSSLSDPMSDTKSAIKPPIVRGARACTVCRAAKMKCVGAEDGQKSCQRCKRANLECVFEKHRRGRKPGSKLSEASKMLRRLEKGLNNAKMKSHAADSSPFQTTDPHGVAGQDSLYGGMRQANDSYPSNGARFPSNELAPLSFSNYPGPDDYPHPRSGSRSEEETEPNDETIFPATLIKRESYFRTILNSDDPPPHSGPSGRGPSYTPPQQSRLAPIPSGLNDPITAGIITEDDARVLFDIIFLRLNPFINLFDPTLHSVAYVRSKCPLLFTTLIMAACRFFRHEAFKPCQKLANELALRAFAEAWKRVEVVQAFACLTYWRNPDDNRTWTYIGYACRMAVELGLNRYIAHPPPTETEFQMLERRNRERTYLVLFVHDRSLSTQTGRHWMLPEDELIRHSITWHKRGGGLVRPEDVVIAAFVSLRRITAETTDVFSTSKDTGSGAHHDVNYDLVLRNCNAKLTVWADEWKHEIDRAGGQKFHSSFLSLFRLHVRLFLNSFALQAALSPSSRQSPSVQALSTCCSSALESLRIVSEDFRSMAMLRYGQDTVLVMSAYSAIILLKLLRNPKTSSQLIGTTAQDIHQLIIKTADAYQDAAQLTPESIPCAYHARFLRNLVSNDSSKPRRSEDDHRENGVHLDPRLPGPPSSHISVPSPQYPQSIPPVHESPFHFQASSHMAVAEPPAIREEEYVAQPTPSRNAYNPGVSASAVPVSAEGPGNYHLQPQPPQHASELDAHYWKNMFLELGFGENGEPQSAQPQCSPDGRHIPQHYVDASHHHHMHTQLLQSQQPQQHPQNHQPHPHQQHPQNHQPHPHQQHPQNHQPHQHQQHPHQQHQHHPQHHQHQQQHQAHMPYQQQQMHQTSQSNGYGR